MNPIQEKLHIIKAKSRLSQEDLARELGVTLSAFNAWWNGKSTPRNGALLKIEDLYAKYTGSGKPKTSEIDIILSQIDDAYRNYDNILSHILNRRDVLENLIVKLTYHSDAIEGSTLTQAETKAIIYDNSTIKNKTLIEQMEARNHKSALMYLFSHLESGGKINEELLKKLHSILLNGIMDNAGQYRNHQVRIAGTNVVTANYMSIPNLVNKLFLNSAALKVNPERSPGEAENIIAFVTKFHANFEKIHPFSDGNGRVGRLLITAFLLKNNVAPAIIEKDLKHLYYTYLENAQEHENYAFLELFIAEAIMKGYKEVK